MSHASPQGSVPTIRVQRVNEHGVNRDGNFVLYWMIANRRTHWNFSLERAVEWAVDLKKPLVILEALRCDYKWASDRIHQFVVQGMAANQALLKNRPVRYYPYLEYAHGEGSGLLKALAERACLVVSDDFPCFFLPRMLKAAARVVPVAFELVDSNGVLPMRAAEKVFARAFDFRRFLQKNLRPHLDELPKADPLKKVRLPRITDELTDISRRWPQADVNALAEDPAWLAELPLDHQVKVVPIPGGQPAAQAQLATFLGQRLPDYEEARNQPQQEVTSGLSPYLHFGQISAHEVFAETMANENWSPGKLSKKTTGSSSGWWGTSSTAESFLDELITWRELGYNMCWQRSDYNRYSSLPVWAKQTLSEHADDPRQHLYELSQFERAETHDALWNAAQRQLTREGRMHNYLRMLWGKKILEWSPTPQDALQVMIELNNKYALDGRNPNSYSGIFWVLGRYDRAWGPERPIFGKIRYMSSENTARKVKVSSYLQEYGPNEQRDLFEVED